MALQMVGTSIDGPINCRGHDRGPYKWYVPRLRAIQMVDALLKALQMVGASFDGPTNGMDPD